MDHGLAFRAPPVPGGTRKGARGSAEGEARRDRPP